MHLLFRSQTLKSPASCHDLSCQSAVICSEAILPASAYGTALCQPTALRGQAKAHWFENRLQGSWNFQSGLMGLRLREGRKPDAKRM